ncbi:hypothetical protein GEMRC1_000419 [Eukaryota sp. GEM-RC1]
MIFNSFLKLSKISPVEIIILDYPTTDDVDCMTSYDFSKAGSVLISAIELLIADFSTDLKLHDKFRPFFLSGLLESAVVGLSMACDLSLQGKSVNLVGFQFFNPHFPQEKDFFDILVRDLAEKLSINPSVTPLSLSVEHLFCQQFLNFYSKPFLVSLLANSSFNSLSFCQKMQVYYNSFASKYFEYFKFCEGA